jgi:hypothetical protein
MHTVDTVYEVDSVYMSTSAIQPRETGIRDGVDPRSVSELVTSRLERLRSN